MDPLVRILNTNVKIRTNNICRVPIQAEENRKTNKILCQLYLSQREWDHSKSYNGTVRTRVWTNERNREKHWY